MDIETLALLSAWSLKETGVKVHADGHIEHSPCETGVTFTRMEWDLTDARCREIVREYFRIETREHSGGWLSIRYVWVRKTDKDGCTKRFCANGKGGSIAEAELACINSIRLHAS